MKEELKEYDEIFKDSAGKWRILNCELDQKIQE